MPNGKRNATTTVAMSQSGPPPTTLNLVLNSQFATLDRHGDYVFNQPVKSRVVKMQLGTIELAPTQRAIEDEWSRVVFHEGLTLPTHDSRVVRATDDSPYAYLPMSRNVITGIAPVTGDAPGLDITTEYPHGLFGADGSNLARLYGAELGIVLTPSGISLASATLSEISARTFRATWPAPSGDASRAIEAQLRAAGLGIVGPSVQAGAIRDLDELSQLVAAVTGAPRLDATEYNFRLPLGGPIASELDGGDIPSFVARLWPKRVASEGLGATFSESMGRLRLRPLAPATTGSGAPGRKPGGADKDQPRGSQKDDDARLGHLHIDIGTRSIGIPLSSSSYTLETLGTTVNAVLSLTDAPLRLAFNLHSDGRLEIASHSGAIFGIDFAQPTSIDGAAIGFTAPLYDGRASYKAEDGISAPVLAGRAPRLRYRLRGGSGDGTMLAIESERPTLRLRDGCLPRGEIVDVRPGDLVYVSGRGLLHVAPQGVSVDFDDAGVPTMRLSFDESSADVSGRMVVAPDATFTLHMNARHINRVQGCLVPSRLGFLPQVYREAGGWGGDARSAVRGACVPSPVYVAHGMPSLDHPPYVLLHVTVNGMPLGPTQVAVLDDNRTMHLFAKVCLANYRVERANPTEVSIPDGRNVNELVVGIFNPDGTRYVTHGSPFGLSMNVVTFEP